MKGFGLSDIGLVRERNEDSFLWIPPFLGAVADGMGGHQGGQEASKMAITVAENKLKPENQPSKGQFESWLAETVEDINLQIFHKSQENQILLGMGTTLSIVYFFENQMYWAHVGDCRIYLFRDGNLKQITKDHALASSKKKSHILTRALGISKDVIVDTGTLPTFPKDQILLSSDGLHDVIEEKSLKMVLEKEGFSSKEKVQKMIEIANKHGGGPDNITALVMLIE